MTAEATLAAVIKQLEERKKDFEIEYQMCGHSAICNRISELNDVLELIKDQMRLLKPKVSTSKKEVE